MSVESVKLNMNKLFIKVGDTRQLVATVLPEDIDDKHIIWETSNKNVAVVSGGKVTGITANPDPSVPITITAYSNKDKTKYDAVANTKGYRWLESEYIRHNNMQDIIDISYYQVLVDKALATIEKFGNAQEFINA